MEKRRREGEKEKKRKGKRKKERENKRKRGLYCNLGRKTSSLSCGIIFASSSPFNPL